MFLIDEHVLVLMIEFENVRSRLYIIYFELVAANSVTSCHLPFTIIKLIPLVFDR